MKRRQRWVLLVTLSLLMTALISGFWFRSNQVSNAQVVSGLAYNAQFVCGIQSDPLDSGFPVASGYYATDINILNHNNFDVFIDKNVIVLFDGSPVGREPNAVTVSASDSILLPDNHATFDDCQRIRTLLGLPSGNSPLITGYFQIVTQEEITVKAIYSTSPLLFNFGRRATPAIEVERIRQEEI